jgi:putative ATPase
LELVTDALGSKATITDEAVMEIAQQRIALYDKKGEQHYDIISAFIKSIRGSDPNAAVYYLARMIEGGEDVKFIARRMLIVASEDIGNANPNALLLANATFDAVNKIGYPESQLILSQCAIYLASSAKSNAATVAIGAAMAAVKTHGDLPVPLHIRNAPTKLMKKEGYGKGYEYSHNYENNFSAQEYLPDAISGTAFFEPGKNLREEELRKFLKSLWKDKYGY